MDRPNFEEKTTKKSEEAITSFFDSNRLDIGDDFASGLQGEEMCRRQKQEMKTDDDKETKK